MTTPFLAQDIKADEGCRLHAYPDPRSGAEPWTIGYGCTGQDIGAATVWTQVQADAALQQRLCAIETSLDHAIPWWRTLSDPRQDVLVNMGYNLGVEGLLRFETVLEDGRQGLYASAAEAMLRSAWAEEVGGRARRLARQMRTGVRAAAASPGRAA